eukprot:50815-Rhodomonas_salina.1
MPVQGGPHSGTTPLSPYCILLHASPLLYPSVCALRPYCILLPTVSTYPRAILLCIHLRTRATTCGTEPAMVLSAYAM